MKKISNAFFILMIMFIFVFPVWATVGNVVGQVDAIRTHDANQYSAWAPPKFWFTLKGVTVAGSCPVFGPTGEILFVGTDKSQLSFILTSQSAGQNVGVYYDDTLMINNYCQVQYLTISNYLPSVQR